MEFGIDAIDYYLPNIALPIVSLAEKRDIIPAKLEKGLGLKYMALADVNEDTASMAANALLNLIVNNKIDPSTIGRIYLGTESAVDAAKPTATYAVGTVEKILSKSHGARCFKNCDVVDLTFACIGGIDAVENCLDWIRINPEKKAIVIASDIAKYELDSSGEYTQGAGAVAMLLTSNPSIISFKNTVGISMEHVGDFFKPRRKIDNSFLSEKNTTVQKLTNSDKEIIDFYFEEPVFDGQYSNKCYTDRINEGLEHFQSQKKIDFLKDWDHLIFHLPYAFQGRRMIVNKWLDWMKENGNFDSIYSEIGKPESSNDNEWIKKVAKSSIYKSFIEEKISPGEKASSEIGNMYTASIFMSLISSLVEAVENDKKFENKKIGFISYGSGSKAKIFEGTVQKDWMNKIKPINLFDNLNKRKKINIDVYENLHKRKVSSNINFFIKFNFFKG